MVRKKNLCVQTLERFSYVLLFWQRFEYPIVTLDISHLYHCVVGYHVDIHFRCYVVQYIILSKYHTHTNVSIHLPDAVQCQKDMIILLLGILRLEGRKVDRVRK